jgi:putative restriction endonuclease
VGERAAFRRAGYLIACRGDRIGATVERDELLRQTAFLALDALRARFGDDLPRSALAPGFVFDGDRVPFFNWQKGIFRSRRQAGPAALSIFTSQKSPYDDERAEDGFWYAYRAGDIDQSDNRALRAACLSAVPIVYFVGTPGGYQALYPAYVIEDDEHARRVRVTVGTFRLGEAVFPAEIAERRYAVREVRVRLHQSRFRGIVLPAYSNSCAICRLKEPRLLDAAHIAADSDETGVPVISNGLSLCSIHHRAYDEDLVSVDPDYRVHVSRRLLEEDDGPMLDLLKGFHRAPIVLPRSPAKRPDRDRLAVRFERFAAR